MTPEDGSGTFLVRSPKPAWWRRRARKRWLATWKPRSDASVNKGEPWQSGHTLFGMPIVENRHVPKGTVYLVNPRAVIDDFPWRFVKETE